MTKDDEIFLDFQREIDETKWHYEDNRVIFNLLKEKKKSFFDDQIKYLEQCLVFILSQTWREEEGEAFSWNPEYFLLGHFFEGLLRLILMKELPVEEFFAKCFTPIESIDQRFEKLTKEEKEKYGRFKTFGKLQKKFLKLQKISSLSKDQSDRVKHVLEYVGLQRNKHAHQHPKGMDTYSVRYDIYLLIKVLSEIFGIKFSEETTKMLQLKIELLLKNFSGIRYEPVWEVQIFSSFRGKQ